MTTHSTTANAPSTAHRTASLVALVVDDHMLMRRIVSDHLKKLGFPKIDQAIHGKEAWDMMQNQAYDLVLLDWAMPVMDGYAFLQECRKDHRFDKTAIVMLTAECEQHNVLNALQAGANSYIVKPISFDTLAQKMDSVLDWIERKRSE